MGKERLFRVLVIAISLKGNKIGHSKDEIAESQFAAPIDELLAGDFIEEVIDNDGTSEEDAKNAEAEKAKLEADQKDEDEAKKLKEEEDAKNAEAEKANATQNNQSDLGDIANSIPGGKANTSKK